MKSARMKSTRIRSAISSAGAVLASIACCADAAADSMAELSPVVVTATRVVQSSFDLPASIDRVDQRQIETGQLQVNLSEPLLFVPGVSAESRQNYAQDIQLSIRGFGARSSFGVRGVRLYSDGIPGTMPDGQGQFSQFDLSSADHIEVLRGPFSALYGNSSGGVIAIYTEDAKPGYQLGGTVEYGTFDTQRYSVKTTGDDGTVNYVADLSHFRTNGYREHSQAERNNFNSKLRVEPSATSKLTLVVNAIQTPSVQDPLGLTAAQVEQNPTQAGKNAIAYNTRKSLAQEQAGITYENQLNSNDGLAATLYGGHRATTQYQAIPTFTEAPPTDPGGVIDLSHDYWGVDLHVTDQRSLAGGPLQLVGGVNYDDLQEARKGYVNFVGSELGVEGPLRVDEANQVYDFDQYLQAQWDPGARWRLIAGVRNNAVDVESHNHLADGQAPDSGVRYTAVDPVAGVTFRATPLLNAYASYGKGFETPTLNDLAYRSVNGSLPGLNYGLKPARSDNYEVGLKTGNEHVRANLAAFYIKTVDELAVLENADGKTVDQNIGETMRRGLELAVDSTWAGGFSSRAAYTYIRAVTVQGYDTCVGTPCEPAAVAPGSYLPAVPRNSLYAGLTWSYAPLGFSATAEVQSRARIYADDRNTQAAAGYWVANFRAGFEQQTAHWHLSEFGRIDNMADRSYIGSVIVNATNSQYFEPAPGRTAYIFFTAAHRN
jgi:iron complex outermembrane recepter protein